MKTIRITSFLAMLLCANSLMAQLKVIIKTGGDDLRGGQAAYAQLIYKNGTISPEFDLNGGANWGNNSENTKSFSIASSVRPEDIASVRIRHDGTPHKPFETYDNWNVDYLFVSLNGSQIVQCSGTPWYRFTGESRVMNCKSSYSQQLTSSFVGCWTTTFERCIKPDVGQNIIVTKLPSGELLGFYPAGGGYLIGRISANGKVWSGQWYSANCNETPCEGTFRFELTDTDTFKGNYDTKKGCPNPAADCLGKMWWNGSRVK